MQPIQQLLSRLRWDPRFRRGCYEIGYYDRQERRIIRLPFAALSFPPAAHRVFEWRDAEGQTRRIPYHRVRRVWRDGRLLWQRNPAHQASGPEPRA
jgi:uncharacterized protein (UPF0248 family)